jgi:hypothetical protein
LSIIANPASHPFLEFVLLVEEGRLSGGRQQSLPILLIGPKAILISTDHLLNRDHSHPVLEMPNGEVRVSAHESLDTAEGDLAVCGDEYQQSLVSKALAGTVLTAFWESKM